eukprot:TRINITY_DN86892_c0_g1_i1.p1 TRINITY_DN86892_c0_g1~~TRINITY_DN86892_c0_g1_i1.p1  ORF type:complete len:141 (-),score=15.48 TRINITY_DN86892_c0_g1_i1:183-605(-)
MDRADNQILEMACPFCGKAGHTSYGESIASGELRWYRSISCPTSGQNIEEDGTGVGPPILRNELLKSKGTWSVLVEDTGKIKAAATAKRLFSLSNYDASSLLKSFPALRVGTKAEAAWLVDALNRQGVKSELEGQGDSGS